MGRGTLLAERYRLSRPLISDLAGTQLWEARDEVLDRAVQVTVITAGPIAKALDAARRAALVAEPRLVRIQDVGETEGVGYVISEAVHGPSLQDLVAHGPIVAGQARAMVGEAAAALETARRRGVHHLALRPSVLHRTPDGRVVLTGAAIDGTLMGTTLGDARSTSRADAVGLVALLYFALTGRWPGVKLPGLPAAPHVNGAPVPPSDLVPGVPNDLDTLCAVTLGPHDDGPHSPGELVRDLAPWPAISLGDPLSPEQPGDAADTGEMASVGDIVPADSTAAFDVAAIFAADDAATAAVAATSAAKNAEAAPSAGPRKVARKSVRTTLGSAAGVAIPGTPPPAVPARRPPLPPIPPTPAAALGVPVLAALGLAGPASAGANTDGADTDGAGMTRPIVPIAPSHGAPPTVPGGIDVRPVPPVSPVPPRPASPPVFAPAARTARPGSGPPGGPADALRTSRDPTRMVLLIAALLVVIGLVVAVKAFTAPAHLQNAGQSTTASTKPSGTATPSASSSSASPSNTPSNAPVGPVGSPIALSGAQSLDPPPAGDNNEHPDEAGRAIDGDPTTFWRSRTYKNPKMPGRPGIGFAVTLAQPGTVKAVTLHVNGAGGNVEIRATDPSTPMTGAVLAQGAFGPDVTFTFAQPVQAQSIVLWITELPQTADGSNRIELAEVLVS